MGLNTLQAYPILHSFLARLYKLYDIYETDDMFEYIQDDLVSDYCKCGDATCSSVYLRSDRLPVLDNGEEEYIETYNSHNGLLVLHFNINGNIEIEALEYEEYPFKEELKLVYNGEKSYTNKNHVQKSVNEYFKSEQTKLETIVID